MKRRLRSYQVAAFGYARRTQYPALFMDMRLGKTLVAIRRLQVARVKRVLVVAPTSALPSWQGELALEKETSVVLLLGQKASRRKLLKQKAVWYLFNKEGFLALPEVKDVSWDAVVLDESTFIKNPKAKVTKFYTSNFRDVPLRMILTGLPNPEGPLDFFTQFEFLRPRPFHQSNYWAFRNLFFQQVGHEWLPKPGGEKLISTYVKENSFVLGRKDVSSEEKVYETRIIEMPDYVRKVYDTIERDFVLETPEGKFVNDTKFAIVKFTWLRRLCGGFLPDDVSGFITYPLEHRKTDYGWWFGWDAKGLALLELLLGELRQEQVVVWFDFNAELDIMGKSLHSHRVDVARLDGSVPAAQRGDVVEDFRKGMTRVLLVQQRVAQMGMNFSCADTAIYYSNPLGLQARMQTEDRIVLPNKPTALLYVDIVVKGTIDEDIKWALASKKIRSSRVLRAELFQRMKERVDARS